MTGATGLRRRKALVAWAVGGVAMVMVGASFAAVPLYDLFCRVTGFAGTPSVASAPRTAVASDRVIKVRFAAVTNPALEWEFAPVQAEIPVRVGASALAFYTARNLTDRPLVGTATFNVTPLKVGAYFAKVDCFCFTEQYLPPAGSADLPVSFFIDPAILTDRDMDDVRTITLAYTFFDAGPEALARYVAEAPGADETGDSTESTQSIN